MAITKDSYSEVKRIPLKSSKMTSLGYDAAKMISEIKFYHGALYQHFDDPEKVCEEFKSSSSTSSCFMNNIKSNFYYHEKKHFVFSVFYVSLPMKRTHHQNGCLYKLSVSFSILSYVD